MRKLHLRTKVLVTLFTVIFLTSFKMKAEEKILYSTNFQDWTAFSATAVGATNTVSATTNFTKESFTFTFSEIQCVPTGTNTKFVAPTTTGYVMCAKTATTNFTTSALATVTKIYICEAATGSSRGFQVWKKATSDADWVSIYSTYANPAGGDSTTIAIPGDQTNVQLKFTNLASAQNAYLTDLVIYGNYATTAQQQRITTSVNVSGAGTVTVNPSSSSYDQGTSVLLTAKRNFGYSFVQWIDSTTNAVLSTKDTMSVVLNSDKHIQAVFAAVNTYALNLTTTGAPSYMVAVSPAATVQNGQNMYESGTTVTLTASNNPITTFTNWSTGETSSTKTISMTQNQTIAASFSSVDYIVGWDLYKAGGSSRPADFYSSTDNQTAALILRKADGTVNSWLDKSMVAAAGYYNRGAAVNWKPVADQYYYQISFNATDYTDIKVAAGLLYNYNAYTVQKCEYSLDGTTFTQLGTYTLTAGQTWFDNTFTLPANANHAAKVYVRWIPDYTSSMAGATAAANDGTAISNIYVTATAAIYNDGTAPVLSSSVPAASATTASTTGKIVLTFDEKVQLASGTTATLGTKTLTPTVTGTTVTFPYTGLDYNTPYTFTLAANTVSDLAGNTKTSPVTISFTTMTRPTVTKKNFDFVVGVDGDFKAALAAATAASSSGDRFRIFFPNGNYNIGANTGDSNQKTTVGLSNLSLIGQSSDGVVLYNQNTSEGIGVTATMYFTSAANNEYLQDLTLKNKDYRSGVPSIGRCVALQDQGTKNIYKNVNVLSNQDTYYSGSGRNYFEGGSLHGTVDFLCGGGDIMFNECLLYLEDRTGCVITAPATASTWGYVFLNCTIDGFSSTNGNYYLGRPWQNAPKSVYINTKMNVLPTAAGWTEMGVVPGLFAEYNSRTTSGSVVDLTSRKTSYTYSGVTTAAPNPVLTATQAAQYTVENVMGGTDAWQPQLYTDQATVPVISASNGTLSWPDNNYVLCWAVFKDDVFVKFVTTNSYSIPWNATSGVYTVRAANEMGGLSAASNGYSFTASATGFEVPNASSRIVSQSYYTFDGRKLARLKGYQGTVIIRSVYADGHVESSKIIKLHD